MTSDLRRLNDTGIAQFSAWLSTGAQGSAPISLLGDPETSEPLTVSILPARRSFVDRFAFGSYLNDLLKILDTATLMHDRGLWTALGLFYFDDICPVDGNGARKLRKEWHYVLSTSFRHYYRHLIRSPWQLVRDHGENAKILLLAPGKEGSHPLRRHGEILEQLAGRQGVLRSKPVIAEVRQLYTDEITGRPKKGVSGDGRGSARRLALVLQQFDLTFDADSMRPGTLIDLLPAEFDRWKTKDKTSPERAA